LYSTQLKGFTNRISEDRSTTETGNVLGSKTAVANLFFYVQVREVF